jgi:hypothetical protein
MLADGEAMLALNRMPRGQAVPVRIAKKKPIANSNLTIPRFNGASG